MSPPAARRGAPTVTIMPSDPSSGADRFLLAEAVLAIILFGVAVGFFIIPAASPDFVPGWWVGFLIAILFFAIVLIETFRRHARGREELRRALDHEAPPEPDPTGRDPKLD